MKNDIFLDVTPCGSCKNRRFGGSYSLHHQGEALFCTQCLYVEQNELSDGCNSAGTVFCRGVDVFGLKILLSIHSS
jgi:hypothetical protein